jgi:hypothetical protein
MKSMPNAPETRAQARMSLLFARVRSIEAIDRAAEPFLHGNLSPRFKTNRNSELALDMDLAEKYYLQALSLSSNKEFKAKALFMTAKAEQNRRPHTATLADPADICRPSLESLILLPKIQTAD